MATPSDINEVRNNTDEPSQDNWSDDNIAELVDLYGVAGASARVWRGKAAKLAGVVDTTIAGVTHKFSDLRKTAEGNAVMYEALAVQALASGPRRTRVHKIERS